MVTWKTLETYLHQVNQYLWSLKSIFWVHFYLTDFLFPWTFFAHSSVCQQLGRHRVVWASSHSASVERRILTLVSVHLFSLSLVSGQLFLWFKSGRLFLWFFDFNLATSFFDSLILWFKSSHLFLWFKSGHLFLWFFDLNPVASFFPWFKFYSICWQEAASLISILPHSFFDFTLVTFLISIVFNLLCNLQFTLVTSLFLWF